MIGHIPLGMLKEILGDNDISLHKRIKVAEEQIEYCNKMVEFIEKNYLNDLYDQRDEEEAKNC